MAKKKQGFHFRLKQRPNIDELSVRDRPIDGHPPADDDQPSQSQEEQVEAQAGQAGQAGQEEAGQEAGRSGQPGHGTPGPSAESPSSRQSPPRRPGGSMLERSLEKQLHAVPEEDDVTPSASPTPPDVSAGPTASATPASAAESAAAPWSPPSPPSPPPGQVGQPGPDEAVSPPQAAPVSGPDGPSAGTSALPWRKKSPPAAESEAEEPSVHEPATPEQAAPEQGDREQAISEPVEPVLQGESPQPEQGGGFSAEGLTEYDEDSEAAIGQSAGSPGLDTDTTRVHAGDNGDYDSTTLEDTSQIYDEEVKETLARISEMAQHLDDPDLQQGNEALVSTDMVESGRLEGEAPEPIMSQTSEPDQQPDNSSMVVSASEESVDTAPDDEQSMEDPDMAENQSRNLAQADHAPGHHPSIVERSFEKRILDPHPQSSEAMGSEPGLSASPAGAVARGGGDQERLILRISEDAAQAAQSASKAAHAAAEVLHHAETIIEETRKRSRATARWVALVTVLLLLLSGLFAWYYYTGMQGRALVQQVGKDHGRLTEQVASLGMAVDGLRQQDQQLQQLTGDGVVDVKLDISKLKERLVGQESLLEERSQSLQQTMQEARQAIDEVNSGVTENRRVMDVQVKTINRDLTYLEGQLRDLRGLLLELQNRLNQAPREMELPDIIQNSENSSPDNLSSGPPSPSMVPVAD